MSLLVHLVPEICLSTGGTALLLLGALRDDKPMGDFLRWLALVVLGSACVALVGLHGSPAPMVAEGWLTTTSLNTLLGLVFLGAIAWTLLATSVPESSAGEWYSLLVFSGLGMLILARSSSLAALFLGLEVLSLSLYVLISFWYDRRISLRAGATYLVLAGFGSGFLVFGLAMLFAAFGTLDIPRIGNVLTGSTGGIYPPLGLLGFALFFVGVGFKLAVVPFHMWTPEVYEGSPGPIAGLIASASKGAVIAALIPFAFLLGAFWQVIWLLAAASMVGGNLLGLRETRVKRILAYSSIAHIGYILVGYLAGTEGSGITGLTSAVFYVIAYALAILGAFAALALLDRDNVVTLRDLRGIGKRSPVTAFCLLVFVVSLAGLPPTVGFLGKLYLFLATVRAGYVGLALIGLLGTAIGIFYYLRIIVHLFMLPSDASDVKVRTTALQTSVLVITALAVLVLGVFPALLLDLLTMP